MGEGNEPPSDHGGNPDSTHQGHSPGSNGFHSKSSSFYHNPSDVPSTPRPIVSSTYEISRTNQVPGSTGQTDVSIATQRSPGLSTETSSNPPLIVTGESTTVKPSNSYSIPRPMPAVSHKSSPTESTSGTIPVAVSSSSSVLSSPVLSSSSASPPAVPLVSRHSLPNGAIAGAVVGALAVIAAIGAAILFSLRRRNQQRGGKYARPGSSSGPRGIASARIGNGFSAAGAGAFGIAGAKFEEKEKLVHVDSRGEMIGTAISTPAPSPTPAYTPHAQHARGESVSDPSQPMLSVPPPQSAHGGNAAVDRAYYTGIDTTSLASVHGIEGNHATYRYSGEGSFQGEAPPPYMARSLGSGRSAGSGNTLRVPTGPDRRSRGGESVQEESLEALREGMVSPFADPEDDRARGEEGPFADQDAVSEIGDEDGGHRERESVVSELSYQTSLRRNEGVR
ncbi:MAG: hypothetical protein M1820_008613 [Bogoriella megaspora]|nr:MAG: hypothetical protein M1820_008613 [Bogoriella megaspora]